MDGSTIQQTDKTKAFLSELTQLSRKYGLAIGDNCIIFDMEYEDHGLSYTLSPDSALFLGAQ